MLIQSDSHISLQGQEERKLLRSYRRASLTAHRHWDWERETSLEIKVSPLPRLYIRVWRKHVFDQRWNFPHDLDRWGDLSFCAGL